MDVKKIALVTGASRGIGKGIAISLLESGIDVILGYKKNKMLAEQICKAYANAYPVQIDIAHRESIKNAIIEGQTYFSSRINILINNAALAQEKPFHTITDSDWDLIQAVNLRGAFICCQEVVAGMSQSRWGRIVNITSIGGQWGGINQVHYAVAKAGLIGLTRSLAKLYSADGITVNAVSPGLVRTDMSAGEIDSDKGNDKIKNIPIGRIATIEEVADVVTFLSSDKASYMTGQTINVNGGMYLG